MGFKFRKSVKLGGVNLNFSKRGMGFSIPGTGLSYTPSKSRSKKKRKKKINAVNASVSKNPVINNTGSCFDKFNLTLKEMELFLFILNNKDNLQEEFSQHDVACLGHISTNTYYNNLYNKGLLKKPSKGKFSLNMQLIEDVAKEWQDAQDEIALLAAEKKEKTWRTVAWVCRICFIPMIIFGILYALIDTATGITSIAIGIVEFIWSKKYFKEHPKKTIV